MDYDKPVADTVLTSEERSSGTCLSCRAVPVTDVSIALRDDRITMTNRMLRDLRVAKYRASPTRTSAASAERPPEPNHQSTASTTSKEQHRAVCRLGYVHARVTDMADARNHYANTLGMDEQEEVDGKAYLKGWDEWTHHFLVLEEGGVGVVKFGYVVDTEQDRAIAEAGAGAVSD